MAPSVICSAMDGGQTSSHSQKKMYCDCNVFVRHRTCSPIEARLRQESVLKGKLCGWFVIYLKITARVSFLCPFPIILVMLPAVVVLSHPIKCQTKSCIRKCQTNEHVSASHFLRGAVLYVHKLLYLLSFSAQFYLVWAVLFCFHMKHILTVCQKLLDPV